MNSASVLAEHLVDQTQVLGRLHHQLASITLGDLDVALEDCWVAEAQFEGSNGHGLGNRTEVEHALLTQTSEVEKTVLDVFQCVQDHLGTTVQSDIEILRLEEVVKVVDVLGPNLFGPKAAAIIVVFPDITDDIRLLQEETHGLMKMFALQQSGVAKLRLDEQTGETFTDQTGHVVAIQVVLLNGHDAGIVGFGLTGIVGHTVAHLVGDVPDDFLVGGLQVLELGDDVVELNQQLTVLLLRPVAIEGPAIPLEEVLEVAKQRLLGRKRDRGVILDGIQATQDQVEQTHGEQQLGMKFLDNGAKTPAGLVEELEAGLLCFGFVLLVTLMDGDVPDFPIIKRQ